MKLLEARAWCRYLLLFLGSSSSSGSQAIYLSGQFPYDESVRVYAAVIIIVDNHNTNNDDDVVSDKLQVYEND